MSISDSDNVDLALENEEYEELVEIDEFGRVHQPNQVPRDLDKKPTILRDPKGEYI